MIQAFVIVLRKGVEAFLIVDITLAYLRKTSQSHLIRAVSLGIASSILTSALLGYFRSEFLHAATEPFSHEGIYGKWFSILTLVGCGLWLVGRWLQEKLTKKTLSINLFAFREDW